MAVVNQSDFDTFLFRFTMIYESIRLVFREVSLVNKRDAIE